MFGLHEIFQIGKEIFRPDSCTLNKVPLLRQIWDHELIISPGLLKRFLKVAEFTRFFFPWLRVIKITLVSPHGWKPEVMGESLHHYYALGHRSQWAWPFMTDCCFCRTLKVNGSFSLLRERQSRRQDFGHRKAFHFEQWPFILHSSIFDLGKLFASNRHRETLTRPGVWVFEIELCS